MPCQLRDGAVASGATAPCDSGPSRAPVDSACGRRFGSVRYSHRGSSAGDRHRVGAAARRAVRRRLAAQRTGRQQAEGDGHHHRLGASSTPPSVTSRRDASKTPKAAPENPGTEHSRYGPDRLHASHWEISTCSSRCGRSHGETGGSGCRAASSASSRVGAPVGSAVPMMGALDALVHKACQRTYVIERGDSAEPVRKQCREASERLNSLSPWRRLCCLRDFFVSSALVSG